MIANPTAFRYFVRRNAEIDSWRRRQAQRRLEAAIPLYRTAITEWYLQSRAVIDARARACAQLVYCPQSGAVDLIAYYEGGASPPGESRMRASWDKRIQRARAWVFERLDECDREALGRGRGRLPPRPTLRAILMRATASGLIPAPRRSGIR